MKLPCPLVNYRKSYNTSVVDTGEGRGVQPPTHTLPTWDGVDVCLAPSCAGGTQRIDAAAGLSCGSLFRVTALCSGVCAQRGRLVAVVWHQLSRGVWLMAAPDSPLALLFESSFPEPLVKASVSQ